MLQGEVTKEINKNSDTFLSINQWRRNQTPRMKKKKMNIHYPGYSIINERDKQIQILKQVVKMWVQKDSKTYEFRQDMKKLWYQLNVVESHNMSGIILSTCNGYDSWLASKN